MGLRVTTVVRLLVVVLCLSLIAPAALAQTSEQKRRQLEQTRSQLEDAQDDLHSATTEVRRAQVELAEVDARLATARNRLAALEAELVEASAEHEEAQERVDQATHKLAVATNRLNRVRLRLEEREGALDARAVATFKYGTVTYAHALVGSRDFTEFLQSYYFVRSALDADQRLVEEIAALTREHLETRAEVVELRNEALDEEAKAKAAKERVERLTTEQRAVTDEIAAERRNRAAVVARVESERANYQATVAALERESRRVEAELRRLLERERWRAGSAPGAGTLAWPTDGRVTSGFGYRTHPIYRTRRLHTGVDIPAPTGQAIVSAATGRVVHAGWRGGYGLTVIVDHGGGMATLYAHMSALSVSTGQTVSRAQRIGSIGSTGLSTGPHLHFEVRINGVPQDPMRWYR